MLQQRRHGFSRDSLPSISLRPAAEGLTVDPKEEARPLASNGGATVTSAMPHTSSLKGSSVEQTSRPVPLSVTNDQPKETWTAVIQQNLRYTIASVIILVTLAAWLFSRGQPIVCRTSLAPSLVESTSSPLSVFQIREPVPSISASNHVPSRKCGRSQCSNLEHSDPQPACCCAQLLMNHSFAWSYGHPFIG